jgi:hypothetical protein
MLYGLDYPFGGPKVTKDFVSEATIIHYTCVEQSLKTYFGYYFGGFGDMDNYYSDSPPLVGTSNITGMIDAVHAQVSFAAQLAHKMHRTLIWPDAVNIMQHRYDEKNKKTILEHHERMSGIRAISWGSARKANIAAVEGNYLDNLKRINNTELEIVYLDARGSIPELEAEISKLSQRQVAMLDFTNFSPPIHKDVLRVRKREESETKREVEGEKKETAKEEADPLAPTAKWLQEVEKRWFTETFEKGGYKAYSQPLWDKLQKCPRANHPTECLGVCGGG